MRFVHLALQGKHHIDAQAVFRPLRVPGNYRSCEKRKAGAAAVQLRSTRPSLNPPQRPPVQTYAIRSRLQPGPKLCPTFAVQHPELSLSLPPKPPPRLLRLPRNLLPFVPSRDRTPESLRQRSYTYPLQRTPFGSLFDTERISDFNSFANEKNHRHNGARSFPD